MEKKILDFVIERNKILEEIIRLNHLAISEFKNLDQGDLDHFFMTRKYFIEALVHSENRIIAYSMMDWSTYSFNLDYRAEYIALSQEKVDKIGTILNQDKVLSSLTGEEVLEKTA